MYLLNLTVLQFAAVFGSLAAVSVALYLLDRSRRRQVVSTLRFWVSAEQPAAAARRRHINQPWSLILQLASMALLVLAIGQLRLGTPAQAGRDHVIVLDTSAWMAARSGKGTLMDLARQRARQYLRALPSRDRAMLVRADALATPATAFEPDRRKVEAAIAASNPGATALNLDQALAFARHVQTQEGRRPGEIAFVGTGRIAERERGTPQLPRNLRVLTIADAPENCGLRRIGVRRSASDPDTWEIIASARNYGTAPKTVTVAAAFSRVALGTEHLTLEPGEEKEAPFTFRTTAGGILSVDLAPRDAFPGDNHAELELPAQPKLPVTVYSAEPDLLRPVLGSTPRIAATYRKPEEYTADAGGAGLVILDRFVPPSRPAADSLWIDPPPAGSPIPVRQTVTDVPFAGWDSSHPAAHGLHTRDFKLDKASVFEAAPEDGRIGGVAAGPVIVARASRPKIVVFGFHPALSGMRTELAAPLLFANLLRWYAPEIFRHSEISGAAVGAVKVALESDAPASAVRVTGQSGEAVPFALRDRSLQFFSGVPGSVRVIAGDREYLYALTLPQLWDTRWTPPAEARQGLPHFTPVGEAVSDLWPWLALLGGAGLLAEWLLYGRFRRARAARPIDLRRASRPAEVRR